MPLAQRQAETHHGAALDLGRQTLGMQHGAAIGDADKVDDLVLAGFKVNLDLDEARGDGRHHGAVLEIVPGDANEPGSREASHGRFRDPVEVVGHLVTREFASQLDGALRRRRVGHRDLGVVLREDRLACDVIVVGRTAQIHGRDFL